MLFISNLGQVLQITKSQSALKFYSIIFTSFFIFVGKRLVGMLKSHFFIFNTHMVTLTGLCTLFSEQHPDCQSRHDCQSLRQSAMTVAGNQYAFLTLMSSKHAGGS